MHPKYTYPSFSYVLHAAYIPENSRGYMRRHPTVVSTPMVWFERGVGGDVLFLGSAEFGLQHRAPSTSQTFPLTPILQPLTLSTQDEDVTLLVLGGYATSQLEEGYDGDEEEEEYTDSGYDYDSDEEYEDDDYESNDDFVLASESDDSGETVDRARGESATTEQSIGVQSSEDVSSLQNPESSVEDDSSRCS